MPSTARATALNRYPVKGLSAEGLDQVSLQPGQGFPNDRRFGFARPNSGFNPNDPKPLPKTKFYMLARDAVLASLQTHFEDETGTLCIAGPDGLKHFAITTAEGQLAANRFLAAYLQLSDDEEPELYEASPHRFTDVSVVSPAMMNTVSLINLDSVGAFAKTTGQSIAPERFRGNILFSGLAANAELDMVGAEIAIGEARLTIVKRTKRCAATEVDPTTAQRDVPVPKLLHQSYGHMDMGVYAEVTVGGTISPGDAVRLA